MRLNGFQPSLHVCTSRRTYRACDAPGASDVIVGAFVFNFVANLVAVSASRREYVKAGIDETEKRLLPGDAFSDVLQMDAVSLRQIFDALRGVSRAVLLLSLHRLKRKKVIMPPQSRRNEAKPRKSTGRWNISKKHIYSTIT